MTTVMARETLLEKKYLHFCYYFAIIPLCSRSTMLETECAITRLVCTPLVYVQGVITTANMVMARWCFAEDGTELS